LHLSTCLEKDN